MPYVWSLVLLVVGLALFGWLAIRVAGQLRGFRRRQRLVATDLREHVGLLRARTAALRVAVAERRHR